MNYQLLTKSLLVVSCMDNIKLCHIYFLILVLHQQFSICWFLVRIFSGFRSVLASVALFAWVFFVTFLQLPTRSSTGKGVMPMMMFLIILNRLHWSGFVKKPANITSVLQCFIYIPLLSRISFIKKYSILMCLDLLPHDFNPFFLMFIAFICLDR